MRRQGIVTVPSNWLTDIGFGIRNYQQNPSRSLLSAMRGSRIEPLPPKSSRTGSAESGPGSEEGRAPGTRHQAHPRQRPAPQAARSTLLPEGGCGLRLRHAGPGLQGREEQPQSQRRRVYRCSRHSSRSLLLAEPRVRPTGCHPSNAKPEATPLAGHTPC